MSSAELTATEEAEMADCDGDKVVTMMDVLQEQEDFEEDANAVLGASDEKNCTYPKGYIKRQALYACMTCCPDAKSDPTKRAGVCLACSLSCHENHDLVELYTKRNFCCDCGNSKFNSHPCQFISNKSDLNENNSYNQNFSGLYCICNRPYPDPEATFEDEMIQCIICEDWLHASHLEAKVPLNEQYSEMICKGCMKVNEFLYDYSDLAVNFEGEDVDITTVSAGQTNGVSNGDNTNDAKTNVKENGDNDMADVPDKDFAAENTLDNKKESVDKAEFDSTENTADTTVENEQKESKQNTPDTAVAETASSEATEKDSNDNNPADAIATDNNLESRTDDSSIKPDLEKPEHQVADSEDKKSIDEQSNGIDGDNLDSKTDNNINSDETVTKENKEVEPTTKEEDKVEPDTATSEPTQDIDGKTLKNTSQSENEPTEQKDKLESNLEENLDKDDLMESIDRIINGDDDKSKEKTELIGGSENILVDEKNDESTKSSVMNKSISEESKITSHDKDVSDEKSDENKSQNDVDMEDSIPNNGNSTKSNDVEIEQSKENKRKLDEDTTDKVDVKKPKLDDTKGCTRPKGVKRHFKGATFWPCNFRQKLCTCNECITMYKDLSVLFLIDLEDTVSAYETLGKEKTDGRSSQYEIGLQALSSLDRIQQINALTEYNKMRDKLLDFLKSFKDRKEIVKEEDIKAFFAGMKPKREPDGVYFCR